MPGPIPPSGADRGRGRSSSRRDSAVGRRVLVSSGGRVADGYGGGVEAAGPAGALSTPARPAGPDRARPFEAPPPAHPGGPGRPPPGPPPAPARRRPTGRRVLRWAIVVVAVLVVVAAGLYGYARYRWSQVQTAACSTCTPVGSGQPFNVLLVGSDSRAGESAQQARQFGSATQVQGQRSDTIKILHVDPGTGTARLLSIPRDTFVRMSDVPSSSGLSPDQKINTAFDSGPASLIATIQNTFGIPIGHFVEVDFQGLMNAVDTVGGIYLDFPYPVRDDNAGANQSGLDIPRAGCQKLDGAMTLSLARSRYYQYLEGGYWRSDPTSDIGRIERQNIVIQAIAARARSSYNPLTVNAFLGGIVHDVTVDKAMSFSDMLSLVTRYHAFSPSSLQSFTLPVAPGVSPYAGDVEVVQQVQAQQLLRQFLGAAPEAVTTPPLSASGSPLPPPASVPAAPQGPGGSVGAAPSAGTPAPSPSASAPPYDPTVCSP
jgi:LCP family protein required for cell wall assembly